MKAMMDLIHQVHEHILKANELQSVLLKMAEEEMMNEGKEEEMGMMKHGGKEMYPSMKEMK